MKKLEKITKIRVHPDNPRLIKNDKFRKLVNSIKEFPEMSEKRPLIVNKDLVCLGGNMRLKAYREAGIKEVWIDIADWSEEKQKEFIIKDNSGYGEWDWDLLANNWNNTDLNNWGIDVWKSEEFNPELNPETDKKELTKEEFEKKQKEFNEKNYNLESKYIQCICPNCFHEFEIEKP
tara:strand:- start:127 stop:657 length:531 start_codon:yes stop_codon:yes gene_type:complete